jgi:hypothetical protein
MFEKIVLRRSETGPGLTLGDIAEALLFYEKVHVVLDVWSLKSLVDSLGTRELLALLARKRITAFYAEDMLLTQNEVVGSLQYHWFDSGAISGKPGDERPRSGRKGRLAMMLEINGHAPREARNLAERLLAHVRMNRLSSDYFVTGGIPKAAMADLADADYVRAAIRRVLQDTIGFEAFADDLRFEVILVSPKFLVRTNIDFELGNARRKILDPKLEAVSESNLLGGLVDARADTTLASYYGGDFHTSAVNSDIVRIRHAELLKRSGISATERTQFKDIVLPDYPTIREVINSGERSFDEFLKLLDKSDKFRESIHRMSPDANLVHEYFNEVTKEGWISSVPAKTVRYVLVFAVGLSHPVVGAALSWADTFLLDKMGKGWRPNHFVDGKLKPFLDP